MDFGINCFVTDEGMGPAALARALEDRGFGALLLAEHSHIPASRESPYPFGGDLPRPYYRSADPFVALGAAAAVTEKLILGTSVTLLIQRDTIHTANEVATLDLISGGRALLGVGIGWNREEMRNHGTNPATRGARLDEQIQALKAVWTQEQADFHGTYVDFDPIYSWPKPVRQPHPPIYVGGNSAAALRRAAAHADGWMPIVADVAEIKPLFDLMLQTVDRPLPVCLNSVRATTEVIEAAAAGGAERVAFVLSPAPESETLRLLDKVAGLIADYR